LNNALIEGYRIITYRKISKIVTGFDYFLEIEKHFISLISYLK